MKKIIGIIVLMFTVIGYLVQQGLLSKEQVDTFVKGGVNEGIDYLSNNKDDIIDKIGEITEKGIDTAGKATEKIQDVVNKTVSTSSIKSFNKAKKLLEKKIYTQQEFKTTFYCGCEYEGDKVDFQKCGYKSPSKNVNMLKRAETIEWEHIVPAERFGKTFVEWEKGSKDCVDNKGKSFKGRKCANRSAPLFNEMEANIFNLVPAIGEVNGLRSNFDPVNAIIGEYSKKFGNCNIKIYGRLAKFVPNETIKGDIARVYTYMNNKYPDRINLTKEEELMFETWKRLDPATETECKIYQKKSQIAKETIEEMEKECFSFLKN